MKNKLFLVLILLFSIIGYAQKTTISAMIFVGETHGIGFETESINIIKDLDLVISGSFIGNSSIEDFNSMGQEALIGIRYYLDEKNNKGVFFNPLVGYSTVKYTHELDSNIDGKYTYLPYGLEIGYKFSIKRLSMGLKGGFLRKMKIKYSGVVDDDFIDTKGFRVGLFVGYSL
jgi:hypothetical protein